MAHKSKATPKSKTSPKSARKDIKEIEAVVLDYLPYGYKDDKRPLNKREPIILAIGTARFKLLEIIGKKDRPAQLQDVIYIGDGQRMVAERINRHISYDDLTPAAVGELMSAIEEIVVSNEARYVEFYNSARYFTLTKHVLHLLGVSTQKVVAFEEERQKGGPFTSFADIKARIKFSKNPEKYICERVLAELENKTERYRLFTTE